jgi:GTP diphosphokinase / guanosine-3',5'-bis(diphosphate) 3'-diphosphatase
MGDLKNNVSVDTFLNSIQVNRSAEAYQLVYKAYTAAKLCNLGQKRFSGETYLSHSVNVAHILFELDLDENMIVAGLLHYVFKSGCYSKEGILREFGSEVLKLLEGVRRISELKKLTDSDGKEKKKKAVIADLRNLLQDTISDSRMMVIKLANKIQNMRTIRSIKDTKKRMQIARDTLNLYAPIAGRLGIYRIKWELEDIAFSVLDPKAYQEKKRLVASTKEERENYIQSVIDLVNRKLTESGIHATVNGRAKHFYSINKKMIRKGKSFEEILDISAIRIIVDRIDECYRALGLIHSIWEPIKGRFKDYISAPKSNMYQSLHTSVSTLDGKPLEVQIRTREMDRRAELGVAAHWAYKEGVQSEENSTLFEKLVEGIRAWTSNQPPPKREHKPKQREEIHVFTPSGQIITLPKMSTAIDFAFRIHTDVGLHVKGVKVNEKIVPLKYQLQSGEKVEVFTDKNQKPSPLWLNIAKTTSAKRKIRKYLNKLTEEQPALTSNSLYAVIKPVKGIELSPVPKTYPVSKKKKPGNVVENVVTVAGNRHVLTRTAGCCSPKAGDSIIGFITRGRGVTIHKSDCEAIHGLRDSSRLVDASWEEYKYVV